MISLKEKVSQKLSQFLTDSSPKTAAAASSPSSQPDPPEARPYSKAGGSLFSFVSYVLPSAGSENSQAQNHQRNPKPAQSFPINRIKFQKQDEHYRNIEEWAPTCRSEQLEKVNEDHEAVWEKKLDKGFIPGYETNLTASIPCEDLASGRSSSESDVFEEAIDHETPRKLVPNLTDDSAFISPGLYEFLESSLPNIVKGRQWVLLYSTLKDGISLRTLIRKSAGLSGPSLLIVGDMKGAVFGAMLECPLRPTPKRKYQGTNQTFVFTTVYGEPRLFRPTGANRFYYICMNELLALGGGGNFALRLNEDLLSGSSGPCETFGNLGLAHSSEFELKNVELWGFTHISRYLN